MNKKIEDIVNKFNSKQIYLPINKVELEHVINILYLQMFPICEKTDKSKSVQELGFVYKILLKNISNLIDEKQTNKKLDHLFSQLPDIQKRLYNDAASFLDNDPAAESLEEIILTYPGFFALLVHRIAHELHKLQIPIIPRLFSEYAHNQTGIDIHPGAIIGDKFFLDHGTGTVIGETCVIGSNVKMYQGVTLGALYVTKNLSDKKRHPTVEDHVVIYAGATILGGETVIGHNSTIGGNVWLTQSVDPYTLVYYSSEMKVKKIKDFKEPINYVI